MLSESDRLVSGWVPRFSIWEAGTTQCLSKMSKKMSTGFMDDPLQLIIHIFIICFQNPSAQYLQCVYPSTVHITYSENGTAVTSGPASYRVAQCSVPTDPSPTASTPKAAECQLGLESTFVTQSRGLW